MTSAGLRSLRSACSAVFGVGVFSISVPIGIVAVEGYRAASPDELSSADPALMAAPGASVSLGGRIRSDEVEIRRVPGRDHPVLVQPDADGRVHFRMLVSGRVTHRLGSLVFTGLGRPDRLPVDPLGRAATGVLDVAGLPPARLVPRLAVFSFTVPTG